MKKIVIYVKAGCIACEYTEKVIREICKNKQIDIPVICDTSKNLSITVYPTVVFCDDTLEVARISSTMPKDFYETVIDNFEKL